MEQINIKGNNVKPTINCDAVKGLIEIKGKSTIANPLTEIYNSVFDWLEKYQENYQPETVVNIQLEYFNTSSSKCLLDIFKMLQTIHLENEDANVTINWYYEKDDEDMLEAGQDYQDMVKMPFRIKISKPE